MPMVLPCCVPRFITASMALHWYVEALFGWTSSQSGLILMPSRLGSVHAELFSGLGMLKSKSLIMPLGSGFSEASVAVARIAKYQELLGCCSYKSLVNSWTKIA